MTNKQKESKKKSKGDEIHPQSYTTYGFLIFAAAIALWLSLMSFAISPDSKNLLGLMGYTFGWAFHALFGLSSYLIALYIGWIGWRYLFNKPIHYPMLKTLYVGLAILSTSMLLSVIEQDFSTLGRFLNQLFYPGLWQKRLYYHLGGAPFFYFYYDLPFYNFAHIFNTFGVILIFSSIWMASVCFLFKIRLDRLVQRLIERLKSERLAKSQEGTNGDSQENSAAETPKTESSFLRFVKLRIPTQTTAESEVKPSALSASQDMLAIQPDKNPKLRPSISRKEESEEGEDGFDIPQRQVRRKEPADADMEPREYLKKLADASKETEKLKIGKREAALMAQSIHNGDFSQYVLPPTNLLTNPKKVDQSTLKKDLKRQAEVLEETLMSFGIEAKVGQINCGPTITSFEVHPAIGVKVQKIKTLDNDIALNMEAKSIRIIAPIPGKAAVGIEVPNPQPQEVGFKDMLVAYQQSNQKFHIPILLGKAVNGDYVMSDLAKMPHCIIAGATGSGKSVCINTIIMSIVLNAKPDQIKLLMVDPKKVELTPYTRLPHMLAPVITEPQGAAAALNWLVKEMERRYDILKLVGVRNIESFNKRTVNTEFEATLGRDIPPSMPFIVGIIDELADLMMVASQDIETPIARIAQMARAVGIHLILATQRPSREVITGLIKANFPTRISFKVASRINSQIVLDDVGAESLLGNGDMLFLPPGSSHLLRAQGAYVRDEDILSIIQFICNQAPPNYIIQSFDHLMPDLSLNGQLDAELDSLYEQAKEIVLSTGNASTTFLQRKLKVGYARAASLMDQLESQGIVGPAEGSKARKIFAHKGEASDAEEDLFEE